jgi:hypothetical protein
MTITYRTAGAWGLGKGGNLTPGEVDGNFYELSQRIDSVGDGLVPAEIDAITLVGNQLTFVLTDAREFGPYTIPRAAFRFVGSWAASTSYLGNDVIETGEGIFLVLQNHTSATTFDPAREISGQPVYQLMFREPRSQVYAVATSTFEPTLAQVWGYFRCSVACDITIPANTDVPFAIGAELHFRQVTAGEPLSFLAGSGVTLLVPEGKLAETDTGGAVVTCKKVATNTWDVFGVLVDDI